MAVGKKQRSRASAAAPARRSWNPIMFQNPQGVLPGFTFGVLRVEYAGARNSAAAFVKAKLHPVNQTPEGAQWRPSAHRWEVLLPENASDDLMDPRRLVELYERTALPWRQGLLTTVKLTFGENDRLHVAYEKGRAWLRSIVATGLPGLIIQHCPHEAGLDYARHHLHVVILPRKLGLAGFGSCDDELTSDAGQSILYRSWCASRDREGAP